MAYNFCNFLHHVSSYLRIVILVVLTCFFFIAKMLSIIVINRQLSSVQLVIHIFKYISIIFVLIGIMKRAIIVD